MINNGKITEKVRIDAEVLACTSSAGATSVPYNMQNFDRAAVMVAVRGTFTTVQVDLMQTSAATAAMTSAAAGTSGVVLGGVSTNVAITGGVKTLTIAMAADTTGTTDACQFTLTLGTVGPKKFIYTTSTALWQTATANASTKLYFGSTIGSTVNLGIANSMGRLATALNSTLGFGNAVVCTTGLSTGNIRIQVRDNAYGCLAFNTTNAFYTAEINAAAVCWNVRADQLCTASSGAAIFVGAKVATFTTGHSAGFTIVRTPQRYSNCGFVGVLAT